MSSIIAAYDKTLFYNEAGKYCVLRLKTADPMVPEDARDKYRFADHLIRFVAVGYDLPRTDAIKMELDGAWVSGKYGPQFQVDSWHELVPPTIEGVLGYLSSGLLKGIGPKTAGEIVQRFGTDSLNVIETQPEKLLEIKGITVDKLEEIKAGYAESKAVRDLMTVLAPFKLTPKTAMKIYEHFGPDGAALLRKSFYQLCQIPGFGFKRVDAIVVKSGGNLQDPMRVRGALFYALEKSRTEGGHLYLEAEKLLGEALVLLNEKIPQLDQRLQRPQLERELRTMIETNVVVSKKGSIYLPHVFNQESETARKVAEMVLEQPEPVNLRPVMERMERSEYCLVSAGGDVDEDGRDSKISCTELTILKRLDREEFFLHALAYMMDHPGRKCSGHVTKGSGEAEKNGYVVVRGADPVARGKQNSILAFVKEGPDGKTITQVTLTCVDGKRARPNVWYDADLKERTVG